MPGYTMLLDELDTMPAYAESELTRSDALQNKVHQLTLLLERERNGRLDAFDSEFDSIAQPVGSHHDDQGLEGGTGTCCSRDCDARPEHIHQTVGDHKGPTRDPLSGSKERGVIRNRIWKPTTQVLG
ncbi:hypothetical protein DIPPA_34633 [Diplonema papillatum]|nr:hypothetical protein DIPPA_34633 [Diplonema papillatum]